MTSASQASITSRVVRPRALTLIADWVVKLAHEKGSDVAHVPALYCPEVVTAIEHLGIRCFPYDCMWPTKGTWISDLEQPLSPNGVVIWFHPFGYHHRILNEAAATGPVIVDACHALRTIVLNDDLYDNRAVTIFSPRKEFGLNQCGLAFDLRDDIEVHKLKRALPFDILQRCATGQAATRQIAERLQGYIPDPGANDILTHLPMRSDRRDEAIETLRLAGVPAWRWLESWTAVRGNALARFDRLATELLLIPVAAEADRLAYELDIVHNNIELFKLG